MTEAILERAESIVAVTTLMGRIGQPGELAPTVLFMASEGASYMTGQVHCLTKNLPQQLALLASVRNSW